MKLAKHYQLLSPDGLLFAVSLESFKLFKNISLCILKITLSPSCGRNKFSNFGAQPVFCPQDPQNEGSGFQKSNGTQRLT